MRKIIIWFVIVTVQLGNSLKGNISCRLNINNINYFNSTEQRCLLDIKCDKELSHDYGFNFETMVQVEDDINKTLTEIDKKMNIMCDPVNERVIYRIINAAELNLPNFDLPLAWSQVHAVNISHNNLVSIDAHCFGKLEHVTVMDLSYNDIETISPYSFVNSDGIMISMRILLLQGNNLRNIDAVQLSPEKTLEYLDISYNRFESLAFIEKRIYNGLVTINADYNKLTSIGKHFNYMIKLKKLSFIGNSIKLISPVAFSQLISLNYLDFSLNNIETIQPCMFDGLRSLLYLNASHNKIDGITEEYFIDSSSLKILDLSHNNLGQFRLTHLKMFTPINYLLLNDNDLLESDVADVLKLPLKVRKIKIGGNNFNCRHLIYKQAREMVHKSLKTHPKERDEDIEIDCSTAQRIEVFGVSPRDQESKWNFYPEFAHEFPWEEGLDSLREVLNDERSILIEVKLHRFNSSYTQKIADTTVSSSETDSKVTRTSVSDTTIVWTCVLAFLLLLAIAVGVFIWKKYPHSLYGWRILDR